MQDERVSLVAMLDEIDELKKISEDQAREPIERARALSRAELLAVDAMEMALRQGKYID